MSSTNPSWEFNKRPVTGPLGDAKTYQTPGSTTQVTAQTDPGLKPVLYQHAPLLAEAMTAIWSAEIHLNDRLLLPVVLEEWTYLITRLEGLGLAPLVHDARLVHNALDKYQSVKFGEVLPHERAIPRKLEDSHYQALAEFALASFAERLRIWWIGLRRKP